MKSALFILSLGTALVCSAGEAPIDRLLSPLETPAAPAPASKAAASWSRYTPPAPAKSETRPNAAGGTLGPEEIALALEKQLAEHFATDGEVKLTLLRTWAAVKLPAAEWNLAVTEWPTNGIASTFFIKFQVICAGQTISECQMPLKAQLLQEVWMASGRLERGQALDRSQLAVQKMNVIGEQAGFISARVDPANLEVLQPVPAGRPLTKRDVSARPVIRKGQVVEAVAGNGRLSLRMKALALESGATGDLIKLRNLESRKDFNGQILDESKVQVHF